MSINPPGRWQRTGRGARFMLDPPRMVCVDVAHGEPRLVLDELAPVPPEALERVKFAVQARNYRFLKRVHALGRRHMAMQNNPPYFVTAPIKPGGYGYRTALCGQVAYCKEVLPGLYGDQFGPVPFVSWRKSDRVTCQSCLRSLRR